MPTSHSSTSAKLLLLASRAQLQGLARDSMPIPRKGGKQAASLSDLLAFASDPAQCLPRPWPGAGLCEGHSMLLCFC